MKINRVSAAYFSPTDGTKKCVTSIAKVLSEGFKEIDMTQPENRQKDFVFEKEEVLVIGAPVYGGRLPQLPEPLFENIRGNKTPLVLVVSYGNRAYDDALLELKTNLEAQGFLVIAAGAFIAVHSFTDKLGTNRPDDEDALKLKAFGEKIKDKIKGLEEISKLKVKGNKEYCVFIPLPFAPMPDENCVDCKKCAKICPLQAISKEDVRSVDVQKCIDCFACVKACPKNARKVSLPPFQEKVNWLENNFAQSRKEPEIFI